MDIQKSPPEIAKKLWNILKIVFHMMRNGKRKMMVDLQMLLKRGKIAGKAISNLIMLHHHHNYYAALTCRSNDTNTAFVASREYEFSCSDSPVYASNHSKRKSNHHHHRHRHRHRHHAEEFKMVHKVFDILSHYDAMNASPLVTLPGFGRSPMVRQLRVTDSPFPVKDTEEIENHQVDADAEEFIKKFYKDLRKQKRIAAMESPSPYHVWSS